MCYKCYALYDFSKLEFYDKVQHMEVTLIMIYGVLVADVRNKWNHVNLMDSGIVGSANG